VTTHDDLLLATGPSVDPGRWAGIFDELMTRAGARFSRVEPRRRARACGESPCYRVVLLGINAWLAADDVVSLDYRPLAPALKRHFDAVAERARDGPVAAMEAERVPMSRAYSAWIQLTRSSRLTVSSRAGWSVDMCPRIIPTTWSSLSPRAT